MATNNRAVAEFAFTVARNALQRDRSTYSAQKLVRKIARHVDLAISEAEHRAVDKPQCKAGCCFCCRGPTLATVPEIAAISAAVEETFTSAQREQLLARIRDTARSSQDTTPCPLLVDGLCSIYEVRPLRCRTICSLDRSICQQVVDTPTRVGLLPVLHDAYAIGNGALEGLQEGARSCGISPELFDLATALEQVIEGSVFAGDYLTGGSLPPATQDEDVAYFAIRSGDAHGHSESDEEASRAKASLRLGRAASANTGTASALFASLTLPSIYTSDAHLLKSRKRYEQSLDLAIETPLDARSLFNGLERHETFHLAYQGLGVRETLERHGRWLDGIARAALPHLTHPIDTPRKPGRFRLGYISANLSNSNGAKWALGWLENHSSEIETFSFYLGEAFDVGTRQFKGLSHHFYQILGNAQSAAEFIRSLDLDALIYPDLGMNGKNYQFAALRLARLQCTAWGHPVTSGLPTIDCYLSSDLMEPEGAEIEYSEKLVRLPGTGLCYRKVHEFVSQRSLSHFGLPDEPFLFMGQNLSKWTPRHDPLLREISGRSGRPIVFLGQDPRFRERMERAGIGHILLPEVTAFEYDRLLQLAEVSIDPPDWSGGNTTIRALALGTPVVTLPGPYMRGRHSLAFLQTAGMEGLIAKDEEDFVDLVLNQDRRTEAMKGGDANALYDDKSAASALEKVLLEAVPL